MYKLAVIGSFENIILANYTHSLGMANSQHNAFYSCEHNADPRDFVVDAIQTLSIGTDLYQTDLKTIAEHVQ